METPPKKQHLIVRGKSAKEMYEEIHDLKHPRHLSKKQLEKKRAKFKPRIDHRID